MSDRSEGAAMAEPYVRLIAAASHNRNTPLPPFRLQSVGTRGKMCRATAPHHHLRCGLIGTRSIRRYAQIPASSRGHRAGSTATGANGRVRVATRRIIG